MSNPKYFICPITKNVVDSVLKLNSPKFGITATRRQIEYSGGYVNNWTTRDFVKYVHDNSTNIILQRDHGGPLQGISEDDGMVSFEDDSNNFEIIHIDPWKIPGEAYDITKNVINHLYSLNPNLKFEIGTEESIFPMSSSDLAEFLNYLKSNLEPKIFDTIKYVVIQSGVGLNLSDMKNTGNFNRSKMISMIQVVKSFGKEVKEHNGDYLSNDDYTIRFVDGVDSINIGPEFAQIETLAYLEYMSEVQIDEFYEICLKSKKWERWITSPEDITNKKKLIQICGHYCFGSYELPDITEIVMERIISKLKTLP